MKCKECQEQGLKSKILESGLSFTTCMGVQHFWDEEGREHHHDPNFTRTSFKCSNGHSWSSRTFVRLCLASICDWNTRHVGTSNAEAKG